MKIGLVAVDTVNFPNLPLMKLSAWHKAQGDTVELFHDHSLKEADKIYMSKVFSFSPEYQFKIYAKEIIKGGTGYFYPDGGEPLPNEIEHITPDHTIYNNVTMNKAYGFMTRGCPRKCGFCIVGDKEGTKSVKVADVREFWSGQKEIVLLDPNFLACDEHIELLETLKETGAYINFTQGLDARLLTEKNTAMLRSMRIRAVHFALDNYTDKDIIVSKLKLFKEMHGLNKIEIIVYVLCNYNTTIEQDLERIKALNDIDCFPYVMIYNKHLIPQGHILRHLQYWTNSKRQYAACPDFYSYLEYKKKRKQEGNDAKLALCNSL